MNWKSSLVRSALETVGHGVGGVLTDARRGLLDPGGKETDFIFPAT